jgi:hypothetical protein
VVSPYHAQTLEAARNVRETRRCDEKQHMIITMLNLRDTTVTRQVFLTFIAIG